MVSFTQNLNIHIGKLKISGVNNILFIEINDCETFMKGIDYSYYYEQEK